MSPDARSSFRHAVSLTLLAALFLAGLAALFVAVVGVALG